MRITIKTKAYARNKHFHAIFDSLRENGWKATPNVAIDGQVSIDTDAPQDVCEALCANRPSSVSLVIYK